MSGKWPNLPKSSEKGGRAVVSPSLPRDRLWSASKVSVVWSARVGGQQQPRVSLPGTRLQGAGRPGLASCFPEEHAWGGGWVARASPPPPAAGPDDPAPRAGRERGNSGQQGAGKEADFPVGSWPDPPGQAAPGSSPKPTAASPDPEARPTPGTSSPVPGTGPFTPRPPCGHCTPAGAKGRWKATWEPSKPLILHGGLRQENAGAEGPEMRGGVEGRVGHPSVRGSL